ncbi:uncharacterized protein LOC124882568 isoform X1 [Girardinichthys multiradiatus]|uniref:uncharacterized protein LOC124882568 isoform X1 n=1 Tax=Girardinichthys multiradiatus TaxID=208333 RepID=UPI001FAE4814|nr:uncharacterized protein LOC124882568 isoform X1 [Girardinichthys multiradiatus]XP_047244989.1 uncharacterized protein LOC124882568 isoform X1 [Girardinichthys multiradiatus]XP_047244990.1 uncharacterized protein LOC124882568 isoform X1 [Girardinichthys multiradiatus]XP_047244991.1 uncharacterized protein LOC124882568 isoform X1 [Girardinichthys multiradiatus]
MFAERNELQVHLDIWHFMRRFAAGVIMEAHQLYGIFMVRLSRAGKAPNLHPGRRPASATVVQPIAPAAPLLLPAPVPPLQFISLNAGVMVMAAGVGHPSSLLPLAPTLVLPATQVALAPTAIVSVSCSTQRKRRCRTEEEVTGAQKRKCVREIAFNKWTKCGQAKTKEFGHRRFGSATFCPSNSGGKSLKEWLGEQRQLKRDRETHLHNLEVGGSTPVKPPKTGARTLPFELILHIYTFGCSFT